MGVTVLVAFDGDNLGQQIGRLSLADNEAEMRKLSQAIDQAGKVFADWALACGGEIINQGGDEGRIRVGADHLEDLPQLRQKYADIAGTSCTVGIGTRLSQADTALLVGKLRGKDQIVFWSEEVQEELQQAQEEYSQSQLDKIGDHYLEKALQIDKIGDYYLEKALQMPGKFRGKGVGYEQRQYPIRPVEPAAPQKPKAEGSEHSAAEYLIHTIETAAPGSPEATKAAQELEEYLHYLAEVEEATQEEHAAAEEKAKRHSALKQQIAQVLMRVKEQAPVLAELKEVAPEIYQSIVDMTQSIISMAKETLEAPGGEQELHKSNRPTVAAQLFGELEDIRAPKPAHSAIESEGAGIWTSDLVSHLVEPQKERVRNETGFVPKRACLRMMDIDRLEPHRFSEEPDPAEYDNLDDYWHYSGLYDTFHEEVDPIVEQIIQSPETVHPIVTSGRGNIVDGHRRVAAARRLGLTQIPALVEFPRKRRSPSTDRPSLRRGEVIDLFSHKTMRGSANPLVRLLDVDPKLHERVSDILNNEPIFYHKERVGGMGSPMTLSGLLEMGKRVYLDKDRGTHIVSSESPELAAGSRYLIFNPDGTYEHTDKSQKGKIAELPQVTSLSKGDVIELDQYRTTEPTDPPSRTAADSDITAIAGPGGKDTLDLTDKFDMSGYQYIIKHTYGEDDDMAIGYLYQGDKLIGATKVIPKQVATGQSAGRVEGVPQIPPGESIEPWKSASPHSRAWQRHLQVLNDYATDILAQRRERGDTPPFLGKADRPQALHDTLDQLELPNIEEELVPDIRDAYLHGTVADHIPTIKEFGLVPGGLSDDGGEFVGEFYGEDDVEIPERVYMAYGDNIDPAITALAFHVGRKLGKWVTQVTWDDIMNHGALAVRYRQPDESEHEFDQWTEERANQVEHNEGWGLEPGDFYSESTVGVDDILTGSRLVRALKRARQVPDWVKREDEVRGRIKDLIKSKLKSQLGGSVESDTWYHVTPTDRLSDIQSRGLLPNQESAGTTLGVDPNEELMTDWTLPYYRGVPVYLSRVPEHPSVGGLGFQTLQVDIPSDVRLLPDLPSLIDHGAYVDAERNSLWWKEGEEPEPLLPFLDDGELSIPDLMSNPEAIQAAIAVTNSAATMSPIRSGIYPLEKAAEGVGIGRIALELPPGTAQDGATKDAKTPRKVKTITSLGEIKNRQIRTASGTVPAPTDPAEAGTMPRSPDQISIHEIGRDPREKQGE